MDINTLKQISLTYARAAGAAVVAMYLAGETDPKKLAYAFLAGFIGPVAKYFDKSAKDFGLTKQAQPTNQPLILLAIVEWGAFLSSIGCPKQVGKMASCATFTAPRS